MKRIACSLLVAVLAGAAGCTRYRPAAVPMPEPLETQRIGSARVTTEESRYYELRDVQVTADSVIGWQRARPRDRRIALHRGEIRRFEQARVDVVRSGLLAVAAAYVVAVYIGLRGMDW